MTIDAICFRNCGNVAIPAPPYPPFWTGGGGGPPVDPTAPYVYCPTIPSTATTNLEFSIYSRILR